ncbi:TetR/AcrR family transcriptional regulator [Sutterella sp.]|uniref:TetR/AcrR family transcriptional regulator n=1 Tax=Sutterella sp. TaxID=1981025 RepID=UPI0026DF854B|nr:TetR/AcrR family transcriptional regulator [Sutterella sp.]MDO5531814.1 TetR/AcrR family transcriptional regulator [Sutterella sp.]
MNINTEEPAAPVRRKRFQPEDRREQILDAAARCYTRTGSFEVTMIDVAREIGVSRNLIYHYFRNQETLLEALIERETRTFRERITDIPFTTPEETMHLVALTYVRYIAEHADAVTMVFSSPRVLAKISPHITVTLEVIARRFADALGVPWSGTVRTAMLAASEFMVNFVRSSGERLLLADATAADICVEVFRSAAQGAVRFEALAGAREPAKETAAQTIPSEKDPS